VKGRFVSVAKAGDLAENSLLAVEGQGLSILLVRVGGRVYALENTCSHQGLPMENGELDGCLLTCPHHSVSYHVASGAVCDDRGFLGLPPLRTFPVRVEGGSVEVLIPE